MATLRCLTESAVKFQVTWEPETDFAPAFDDETVTEWVERRMNRGHVEAWCMITVTVAWESPSGETYTAHDSLGGCSLDSTGYPDSEVHRLIETHAREHGMYGQALDRLNERLRSIVLEAANIIAALKVD